MGASTYQNPQDLSRPVMGLLYLFVLLLHVKFMYYYYVWPFIAEISRGVVFVDIL